ncbi:MAG: hypothetical protein QNK11_09500 [Legionella sp.]|nr:hypothetical protein [Legionella sp.]
MTDMIDFVDGAGLKIQMTHSEYRSTMLPRNLQMHWDKPDALAAEIMFAFRDEFYSDVEAAAKHLLEIDTKPERAVCLYATVLLQTQKYAEAEAWLLNYLSNHPRHPYVLTNLAKAQNFLGKNTEALTTLEESMALDSNQENAFEWLYDIRREALESEGLSADDAELKSLRSINKQFGGWPCKVRLGNYYAGIHEPETALRYYKVVLRQSWEPVALSYMSGALGENGFIQELIDLVVPIYNVKQHDIMTGFNLLQAYLELKKIEEGEQLLNDLSALELLEFQEKLAWYQEAFSKLMHVEKHAPKKYDSEADLNVEFESIDYPLWCYGWNIKHGFNASQTGKKIALFQFSWEASSDKLSVHVEDTKGRLARALPLFLL